MARLPSQDRSRARVERILVAAAELLSETDVEKITVRTLAARSGVSVGTIYQFFEDVDGVRAAVADRTRRDLRSVLAAACTEAIARASPGRFFSELIDVIGGVQRRHPLIGCLVHIDRSDSFRGAFASELREYVADHIHDIFARAFPKMDGRDRTRKLKVALGALLGALEAIPPRGDPQRLAHVQQAKDLVARYADTAFVPKEHQGAVRTKKTKKR
jgi:AcrR family transcriptional regulator